MTCATARSRSPAGSCPRPTRRSSASIGERPGVYKPVAGERPLWDFPDGTLAGREVASYAVSEALGWDVVPPTLLRDGPHGPGMVQLWRSRTRTRRRSTSSPTGRVPAGSATSSTRSAADDEPVALVHEDSEALRRMAVFDVLVNNGDRKGGHVLAIPDGRRYGVDHGVSFHVENKLRTVLWGWVGRTCATTRRAAIEVVRDDAGDLHRAARRAGHRPRGATRSAAAASGCWTGASSRRRPRRGRRSRGRLLTGRWLGFRPCRRGPRPRCPPSP